MGTNDAVPAGEKTVLIVDDDESICAFLKTVLEIEGFNTEVAFRGDTALEVVRGRKIDLVILDWMMPVLSGFEVLKLLQEDEAHRHIPVVVITARLADLITIATIRKEMNVADFIPKPIKNNEFTFRIHKIMNTTRAPAGNG